MTTAADPDLTPPTVTFSDNLAETANRSTTAISYSMAFSEAVTGLELADFTVTNGTATAVTGEGSNWSLTVTPTLGVASGVIGVTLKAGSVTDLAGNANAAASDANQAIDTVRPVAPKLVTGAAINSVIDPQVTLQTTMGNLVLELDPDHAPVTVANMLAYVNSGFYNGTLFHRTVPNFVVQGGGFVPVTGGYAQRTPTWGPIELEADNGLGNLRGTLAMARTSDPDSATSQFFVNVVDNAFLNASGSSAGYAVFGKVVSGMSIVDVMDNVPTRTVSGLTNFPQTDIVITTATQTRAGSARSNNAVFTLDALEAGAQWAYSLNAGELWTLGTGSSFSVPVGSYAAGTILVRQADAAGNVGQTLGLYSSALVVEVTPPLVTGFLPVDGAVGAAVDANIVLTFSEDIQRGAGTITLRTAEGSLVATYQAASSNRISITGNQLVIDPAADLGYSRGYVVEIAAGAVKDLAGNSHAGTTGYDFSTAAGEAITGGAASETLAGSAGDDTIDGGGGSDSLSFTGTRDEYLLSKTTVGYQAADATAGRDGTDALVGVEILRFADCTVDLTMKQKAALITPAELKTLQELYVGFFNRVPEASGLAYWINEIDAGVSLTAVADRFYQAGVDFGLYSATMTEAEFITVIYANVLGRSGASAPDSSEIGYWRDWLAAHEGSEGAMVLQMLSDSHAFFTGDPEVGWVIDLLDNKALVADYFAIQQGMTYNDPQTNITRGIAIAAAITPDDTSAAIALIGINAFEA